MAGHTEHFESTVQLDSGLIIPAGAATNKVLTSDSSGNATWQPLEPGNTAAIAYRKTAQKIPAKTRTQVKIDTVLNDPGANVSTEKGAYVVPSDGYYLVSGDVALTDVAEASATEVECLIFLNGVAAVFGSRVSTTSKAYITVSAGGLIFAKKGEEIALYISQEDPTVEAERELQVAPSTNRLQVVRADSGPGPAGPEAVFTAHNSVAAQLGTAASSSKVALNTADVDTAGYFDTTNHRFTPQTAGYYQIEGNAGLWGGGIPKGGQVLLNIYKNGALLTPSPAGTASVGAGSAVFGMVPDVTAVVYLNGTTDYVELWGLARNEALEQIATTCTCVFQGFLISNGQKGATGAIGPEGKAGVWTAITFGAKMKEAVGAQVPKVRTESGGAVGRLAGVAAVKTGEELKETETILTVPVGFRPPASVQFVAFAFTTVPAAVGLVLTKEGVLYCNSKNLNAISTLTLDGITWNIT